MAASIAGFPLAALRGRMARTPFHFRVITRDQVEGVGVLIGDYHAEVSKLFSKAYAIDVSSAIALANNYRLVCKNLKDSGTLITVIEGTGETWTNVVPLAADPVVSQVVSPLGTHVVECAWTLLADTVAP